MMDGNPLPIFAYTCLGEKCGVACELEAPLKTPRECRLTPHRHPRKANKTQEPTHIRFISQNQTAVANMRMKTSFIVLLLSLLMFFLFTSDSIQEQQQQQPLPLHMKIKTLLTNIQSYLFPPNLDFRGSVSVSKDEPRVTGASETEGGAGDKFKEAVTKSLGEGKATVEETAKTAAQKLKDTFSSHHDPQEDL
ncbi:unnamed protein product [Lactuca saligna]|uniref:Uncharacterized protein n=1 Tax=Lactuca saligna TaxID=75948 RepID=A0AA36E3W8_LACSI|nr:unnamed protein product [Lactuca saligna]